MILQRYFHWNTYGNPYDLFENRYEKKGWTKVETSSEEGNGQNADLSSYERLLLINFDIIPSTLCVYRFLSTSYSIYFIYFVASFY